MRNRKNTPKKGKRNKNQPKQRKTFSLFKSADRNAQRKRKFQPRTEKSEETSKRQKVVAEVESSDEDEEIEEDPIKQLRETFGSDYLAKAISAVESSDDSDESEEKEAAVDEREEIVENEVEFKEEDEESGGEEEEDVEDTFSKHLSYNLSEQMLKCVQSKPVVVETFTETWPCMGKILVQIPKCEEEKRSPVTSINVEGEQKFAEVGKVPKILKSAKSAVKIQIRDNIARKNVSNDSDSFFTPLQNEIFSVINNYQDFFYPQRTFANAEELRFVYCVHVLNHVLKTRLKVVHHNARLNKKEDVPEEFRDQGLVRPKVLILVPFRDSAYRIVRMFIDILLTEDKGNVINKKRFVDDFTGNELIMPKKNPKPEDYEILFRGNCGDDFKIGISVTKKALKVGLAKHFPSL